MKIINKDNSRILVKDDNTEINISDNQVIKYTGIYYKNNYNIETTFYGIIECCRYRHDLGTTGIYIKPLYVFLDTILYKIIDYKQPTEKYFLYPHLLMLPNIEHYCKPLYFLDTIEVTNIDKLLYLIDEEKTITLDTKFLSNFSTQKM